MIGNFLQVTTVDTGAVVDSLKHTAATFASELHDNPSGALQPFKAGDFIAAQGYTGTVQDASIVSTKLLTVDNRIVIIPNGALSNGNKAFYTELPKRGFSFAYPHMDVHISS